MSFSAKVFKVFIASPSDVANERNIVRAVLNRWNEINTEKFQIVLFPVGWDTHSSPEIGNHPQKIINKKILKDCDLLIGVFWTRFGTPTHEYDSGTEEEIEEHIKTGKPTMLYFSSQPVVPGSYNQEQFEKVQAFKEKCKTRGIFEQYSSIEEFQKSLSDHIQIKINTEPMFDLQESIQLENLITPAQDVKNQLGDEAKTLIKEASQDRNGSIIIIRTAAGRVIQTNGKNMNNQNNPRIRALWENAMKEIENSQLIESVNANREMFKVTKLGYEVADSL
ncbi:MAG: DUF4062 domain-containing protein [Balneolaceae bacterium]|nr:DUF4062 domain-containing protein [Balneolaceae bacterium]